MNECTYFICFSLMVEGKAVLFKKYNINRHFDFTSILIIEMADYIAYIHLG